MRHLLMVTCALIRNSLPEKTLRSYITADGGEEIDDEDDPFQKKPAAPPPPPKRKLKDQT